MTDRKKAQGSLPHLVIVHGEKGGVGKSTVARLLAAWLDERGCSYAAYDGDPMTHDFGRFRDKGSTTDVELDNVVSIRPVLDRLMSRSDDGPKIALVDLSAGAGADLAAWLEATRALKAAADGRLVVTVVFVVGATRTSVEKLRATHEFLGAQVSWVVALNTHLAEHFEVYEASEARKAVMGAGAVELRIPSLDTEIYQEIDKLQISFRTARDDTSKLDFTWAGIVASFLEVAFYEFDACGALLGVPSGAGRT